MLAMRGVLIVDDHAAFRAALRALLEHDGFLVVGEAADGAAALDAVRELQPELVLLDVHFPGEDGFDICERIIEASPRQSPARPTVIMTSGRPQTNFRRRLARSPAAGFIAKDELTARTVAALVERARRS